VTRNPGSVVNEIEYWNKEYGITNFAFYDDALNFDRGNRFKPMLKLIIERKISAYFHTPNALSARWIDQELSDLMFRSGFKTLRLGLETGDDLVHSKIDGKISSCEFDKATDVLKRAGFGFQNMGAYLLAGIPGQSHEDLIWDIDYAFDHGVRPYIAEYSPIPGTPMFEEAKKLSPFDLEREPLCHNNSILPVRDSDFSLEDLERIKGYLRERLNCYEEECL